MVVRSFRQVVSWTVVGVPGVLRTDKIYGLLAPCALRRYKRMYTN